MQKEKLKELLVDGKRVNEELLVETLKPYVGIEGSTGKVFFKPAYTGLTPDGKILVYLLTKKVSFFLELEKKQSSFPKEIQKETGMPVGTVNPKLRSLVSRRFLAQDEHGDYYVPDYAINDIKSLLTTRGGE